MKKIWDFLNGKKRTIGIVIIFLVAYDGLPELVGEQYTGVINYIEYVGLGLAGIGAFHSIMKGKK